MKAWNIFGILVVALAPLLSSTPCQAFWVYTEVTDYDKYMNDGGEGDHYADSDYGGELYVSYAEAWAQIEGTEENTAGAAYAYIYWTDTVLGYDPEHDPPIRAHVTSDVYTKVYAEYARTVSDYDATAAATGYASGYSTSAGVLISEPEAGDIDTDWFNHYITITENGYPIYLREFAYATAETLTTEDKVKAYAYADSETTCEVELVP
jgi:hypothetical protein